jgi:magnesium transporter
MLINCVAYQDGRKLADIDKREISEYLKRPGCFVWVALREPSEAELEEMREEFDLHPLAVEDASHGHQRPKIEEYGDSLFCVMTITELTPTDELRLGEMNVFVGRNYILSIRQGTERGFQEVRARCEREPELLRYGSGYVLYALMDAVVDRYFPVLDSIEMELEAIESRLFEGTAEAGMVRENIEALYFVKQKLTTLKHATGPLQEYAGKLYGGRVPQVCSGLGEYFRDIYDHLTRINQSIDSGYGHHGHPGEPGDDHHRRDGGDEAPRRVGRADRGPDLHLQPLRHELQEHAGARVDVRLSAVSGRDGRHRRLFLVSLPQGGLALRS